MMMMKNNTLKRPATLAIDVLMAKKPRLASPASLPTHSPDPKGVSLWNNSVKLVEDYAGVRPYFDLSQIPSADIAFMRLFLQQHRYLFSVLDFCRCDDDDANGGGGGSEEFNARDAWNHSLLLYRDFGFSRFAFDPNWLAMADRRALLEYVAFHPYLMHVADPSGILETPAPPPPPTTTLILPTRTRVFGASPPPPPPSAVVVNNEPSSVADTRSLRPRRQDLLRELSTGSSQPSSQKQKTPPPTKSSSTRRRDRECPSCGVRYTPTKSHNGRKCPKCKRQTTVDNKLKRLQQQEQQQQPQSVVENEFEVEEEEEEEAGTPLEEGDESVDLGF